MKRIQFSVLTLDEPHELTPYDVLVNFLPSWEADRAAYLKMKSEQCGDFYEVHVSFVPTEGMRYDFLFECDAISKLQVSDSYRGFASTMRYK